MEKISKASAEIDGMLQRVAAAIEEQSATMTSITGEVRTLNEIAESNATSSEQLAASLASLTEAAEAGNRQIARFRT